MPERNAINTLAGQAAPLLLGDVSTPEGIMTHSLFQPTEWSKATPFVVDCIRIPCNSPFAFEIDVTAELTKCATLLIDASFEVLIPPHVVTNTLNPANPPGAAYFVDYLGYSFFNHISIHFGQNKVFDHNKDDLYFSFAERYTDETRSHILPIIYGDATTADRTTLLLNGTQPGKPMIVPIDYAWSLSPTSALPMVSLSQKIRWTFKAENLQHLIVHPIDGSANVEVAPGRKWDVNLLLQVVHTSGAESDHFLRMVSGVDGLTYLINQAQRNKEAISTTQQGVVSVNIKNINRAIKILRFALLPSHLQDNTGRNDYFMFAPQPPLPLPPGPGVNPGMSPYSPIVEWAIKACGLIIQREIGNSYNRYQMRFPMFPSRAGEEIFFQSYSMMPLAPNSTLGFMDYNNLPSCNLEVQLGVGGTGVDPDSPNSPQRLILILNALDYNFWYFNRGNWTRAFN